VKALGTVGHGRDDEVDVATLESICKAETAIFHEVDLDAGMAPPVPREEIHQQALDRLRGTSHSEHSRLPALEGARPVAERFDVYQNLAAATEQALSHRGQPKPAPDAVKERHTQFGLQGMDSPGSCRLTDVESHSCASDAAGIGHGHEGLEIPKVHRYFQFMHQ
jgi:hypothetical protein